MREWGVPTLPHPACLTFGRLESAVARSARRGPAPQTPHPTGPPPNIIHANILTSGRLRTLATGRSNHPRLLDPPAFFSTQTLLQVHGFRLSDRFSRVALRAPPGRAQEAICRGVDLHVVRPIIHLFQHHPSSPLRHVAQWDVHLAFSGGDTFSGALRAEAQRYRLVGASEPQVFCRRLVQLVHPYLPAAAFPLDAASAAATTEAAPSHLTFWGFPCGKNSGLSRDVTQEELEELLTLWP